MQKKTKNTISRLVKKAKKHSQEAAKDELQLIRELTLHVEKVTSYWNEICAPEREK